MTYETISTKEPNLKEIINNEWEKTTFSEVKVKEWLNDVVTKINENEKLSSEIYELVNDYIKKGNLNNSPHFGLITYLKDDASGFFLKSTSFDLPFSRSAIMNGVKGDYIESDNFLTEKLEGFKLTLTNKPSLRMTLCNEEKEKPRNCQCNIL